MAWFQQILLPSIFAVVMCLFVPVYGYSCEYIVCGSNEYCCGDDVCCFSYSTIWYAWVILIFVFVACCSCCIYCCKRRSSGHIIVSNPAVGRQETTAVIVNTQQSVQPHPSQYGAFPAAHQQYNWQYQQQYTGPPPMYQAAGHAPEKKTPSAPQWN